MRQSGAMQDHYDVEHREFRASFKAFVANEIAPHYQEWETAGIAPRSLYAEAGTYGFVGMAVPEEFGGGGTKDFRFNQVIAEELASAGIGGAGLGLTLHNDITTPYFIEYCNPEQAARWLPGIASGETDHGDRDDRTGYRLRPGEHRHHGGARRRRVRVERLEDVHHQRHQQRPRDRGGEDRSHPATHRHVAARRRAGHGGLRARPQPRQDRHAQPGHRRAVLQRRASAGGQPARRRGSGVPLPHGQPRPGAAVDRRHRRGHGACGARRGPSTT